MAKIRDFTSGLIHCIGASLSLIGLIILIIYASINGDAFDIISFTLFGTGLFLSYLFSTLYHWLNISEKKLNVFKKLSHVMNFVLIATSYITICLGPLRGPWGWSIFGIILALSILGIVFSAIWINLSKAITIPLYIAMGIVSIILIIPLIYIYRSSNFFYSLWWLVLSCLFYFISFLIYILKWPKNKFQHFGKHEIFHIILILGSICLYWFVLNYITIF